MTSFRANKPRELSARCVMSLLAAAMMVLGGARAARAHVDPSTCNHPGVAIEFLTYGLFPPNQDDLHLERLSRLERTFNFHPGMVISSHRVEGYGDH